MGFPTSIRVVGLQAALNILNERVVSKGIVPTMSGLLKCGLVLQGRSMERITEQGHVDTGNLRASAYTVWSMGQMGHLAAFKGKSKAAMSKAHNKVMEKANANTPFGTARVEVGYSAFYALYVHEDGVTRNWTGAKFLEMPLLELTPTFIKIIKEEAKGSK